MTTRRRVCGVSAARRALVALVPVLVLACGEPQSPTQPTLNWYVFDEPSGAFEAAARRCSELSEGRFEIRLTALPSDADQQREQLVRRLAAKDADIDIIGMDVIWTAEFAEAGWVLPWRGEPARQATQNRIAATTASATYKGQLWAAPFTTNTQLLWYRTDRVKTPPATWSEMIDMAEALGRQGTIQAQGERYEGLTVFFTSLLASAGGSVLDSLGAQPSLEAAATRAALQIMRRLATSQASAPALSTAREDHARLAFEAGDSSFMLNYTYVWPSARQNAPEVAANMGWARWPAVLDGMPSRVTLGGINLGIGAWSRHPELAFQAAACIASADNQRLAAARGGLPPTMASLYDEPEVRTTFPFADVLRATLRDAVQRPQTPFYSDISLAVSRTLHPMRAIDPDKDLARLRERVARALRSEGLL
jgi:multiple sugar transport system substrate-binding protein